MTCIERSELISIRNRADGMISEKQLNGRWRKAYQNLAEAADRLDAMIARTEVVGTGEVSSKDDVSVG